MVDTEKMVERSRIGQARFTCLYNAAPEWISSILAGSKAAPISLAFTTSQTFSRCANLVFEWALSICWMKTPYTRRRLFFQSVEVLVRPRIQNLHSSFYFSICLHVHILFFQSALRRLPTGWLLNLRFFSFSTKCSPKFIHQTCRILMHLWRIFAIHSAGLTKEAENKGASEKKGWKE